MKEKIFSLTFFILFFVENLFAFPEIPLDFLKIAPIQKNSLFSLLETTSLLNFSTTGNLFEGFNWNTKRPSFEEDEFAFLLQKEWKFSFSKMDMEGYYQTKDSFQQVGSLIQWQFSFFDYFNRYGKKKALAKGKTAFAFTHSMDSFETIQKKWEKIGWSFDRQLSIADQITHLLFQGNVEWEWGGFLSAIDLCETEIYPVGISHLNLFYGQWKFSSFQGNLHHLRFLVGIKGVNPYYQTQLGFFQNSRFDYFMQTFWSVNETYRIKAFFSHRTYTNMPKIGTYLPFENRFGLQLGYYGSIVELEWLLKGSEESDAKGEKQLVFSEKLKNSYRFPKEGKDHEKIEIVHSLQFVPTKKKLTGEVKMEWESIFKEIVLRVGGGCLFQRKEKPENLEDEKEPLAVWKVHFLADFIVQMPLAEGKIYLTFHLGSNRKREFDSDGQKLKRELESLQWGKGNVSCAIYYKRSF